MKPWLGAIIALVLILILAGITYSVYRMTSKNNNTPIPGTPIPGTPIPGTPIPGTSYFTVYAEDCQDVPPSYDMVAIKKLDIFSIDLSLICYASSKSTLSKLGSGTSPIVLVHFDQTDGSVTCGKQSCPYCEKTKIPCTPTPGCEEKVLNPPLSMFAACVKTTTDQLGSTSAKINGILWESEGNKFVNTCNSTTDCKTDYSTAFGRPMLFAGWAVDFNKTWQPLPPKWDYQFIEMYNVYSGCKATGAPGCKLDFNPEGKFKPAVCGPSNSSGCNYSTQGVYGPGLTPEERGKWIAQVVVPPNKMGRPVPEPKKTIIMFPFTSASEPSFKKVITTEAEFNRFVKAFIAELKPHSPGIESCKFGAWGAPNWIIA
jgi:hypothetical protein